MTINAVEHWFGKHAWWIFFVFGILAIITAPILLMGNAPNPPSPTATTGMTFERMAAQVPSLSVYIGSISRELGNFMLATGVMLTLIAAFPYRRGEQWAWAALWIVPILGAIQVNSATAAIASGTIGLVATGFLFAFYAIEAPQILRSGSGPMILGTVNDVLIIPQFLLLAWVAVVFQRRHESTSGSSTAIGVHP